MHELRAPVWPATVLIGIVMWAIGTWHEDDPATSQVMRTWGLGLTTAAAATGIVLLMTRRKS